MSDLMFYGVLRMPYEMTMSSELSRRQFYGRAQEAADRIEATDAKLADLAQELEISQRECGQAVTANAELRDALAAQPAVVEQANCKGCNGHGFVGNTLDTDTCPFCKGTGEEVVEQADTLKQIVDELEDDAAPWDGELADAVDEYVKKLRAIIAATRTVAPVQTGDSIRDYASFREDMERLSEPGLSKATAQAIRKDLYDVIDARVRNLEPVQAAPEGWTLTLVVPDDTMCIAAREKAGAGSNYAAHIYSIMLAARPKAPAWMAPTIPPMWISELCGEGVDDLSYGQGYRRGFNDCRAKVLAAAPAPGAAK